MAGEDHVQLFTELFVNRDDIYGEQWRDGERHGYRAVREKLTPEIVGRHLDGEITLGFYALGADSRAKWLIVDADTTVGSELEQVIESSRKLGLPEPVIEFSGRRGYHFWWFFSKPVLGWQAKRLGQAVTKTHEVFPKQDRVSQDTSNPGSLVKAPLGVHLVSGDYSTLVDEEFVPIDDPWPVLGHVEKVDISDCFSVLLSNEVGGERKRVDQIQGGTLRPCIEKALETGSREGYRNETGHLIACELRRIGVPHQTAAGVLACWNLRNNPRLSQEELALILKSAYFGGPYVYGCQADGQLRRYLECLGDKCRHLAGKDCGESRARQAGG